MKEGMNLLSFVPVSPGLLLGLAAGIPMAPVSVYLIGNC